MLRPRFSRRTKVVATLGPASSSEETIRALFDAGVNVFRLNASHGSQDDHAKRYGIVRTIEREVGHPISILFDLQGPKIRLGAFAGGRAELEPGAAFRFDLNPALGDTRRVSLPHPELFAALRPGVEVLVDDGRMKFRVAGCGADFADTIALTKGVVSNNKGVNLPGVEIPVSALSPKDRADLAFGLNLGVDWIGLSFVQRAQDVIELRSIVGDRAGILCKIEKPAALLELEHIISLSDAVMVARGDLGVELPPEDVPGVQKRIVRVSRAIGRPVVVATQMLESMIHSLSPTRAEASDVATAVFDGADAVMLSAETATGSFPVEAASMMDRIVRRAEQEPIFKQPLQAELDSGEPSDADAITVAARTVASSIRANAIVTFTASGSTTLRAARARPDVPILGLTPNLATARRMTLMWGVHPLHTEGRDIANFSEMASRARTAAVACGIGRLGDKLVITAGVPFGTKGATNSLRVVRIAPDVADEAAQPAD